MMIHRNSHRCTWHHSTVMSKLWSCWSIVVPSWTKRPRYASKPSLINLSCNTHTVTYPTDQFVLFTSSSCCMSLWLCIIGRMLIIPIDWITPDLSDHPGSQTAPRTKPLLYFSLSPCWFRCFYMIFYTIPWFVTRRKWLHCTMQPPRDIRKLWISCVRREPISTSRIRCVSVSYR